ncbi:LPXTG cell wall anchor domain-containing protein [Lactiplantibacillus herbarum]|uniref:LPXTG cell wall anchor domain-containing protein n=1 Tax=Lactiplantibacillus herbarum TaxID=1670446 RepID=UPI00064E38E3|nr:LPXTG cell wall anchor domain-containing protein [Lactiplantibacillus herbarum]
MKKLILGLLAGLLLFIYQPVWSQAQSNSIGTTKTQISFYEGPTTSSDGDQINVNKDIAKSTGPYQTTKAQAATISGSLQQVLKSGRLPQTGENVTRYQQILGGMLLLAILLMWVFYRQLRGEGLQREE